MALHGRGVRRLISLGRRLSDVYKLSSNILTTNTRQLCAPTSQQSELSDSNTVSTESDITATSLSLNGKVCHTPKEASTNLLDFLNQSDVQKRQSNAHIPFFTPGSYISVTRADPYSPSGETRFVGICIARKNNGLGSTFILRNVMNGMGVEMMFELYSPALREIKVLKLERRRRAKLYYLRNKPLKFSIVSEKMEPVNSDGKVLLYRRRRGDPA